MEIQVKYDKLYDLGDKMKNHSLELNNNLNEINDISDELSKILHGEGETAIYNRIKSFNNIKFKKIVNFADVMGDVLNKCAKRYDMIETDFDHEMKKEAAKYDKQ